MRLGEVSESEVRCLVCDRVFKALNGHLGKAHRLTVDEYREKFPGALVSSSSTTECRSKSFSQAMLVFLQTEEGEQWCLQQAETAKQVAAENPGLYSKSEEHKGKIAAAVHSFYEKHPGAAEARMTPELRQQISETVTKHHSDPEYRKKQSDEAKAYCEEHPDFRKKKPGQVEKHKASLDQFLESPEGLEQRRKQSEMMKVLGKQRYLDDPESFQSFIEAGQECVIYRDTKPELAMRDILDSLNLEHEPQGRIDELNKPYRFHRWDFVIRDLKIVVEVDGCYWHAHSKCYPERLQEEEIQCQIALEEQRDLEADLSSWSVLRFWECEVLGQSGEVAECVASAAEYQRRMTA